jgi:RNA processing factor Prp31
VPRNGTFEYLDNCEAIIKSNLIKIKPELKQQIEELQKFSIFKDMNSIDIKTVQYLRNQMGELNEKDQELEKLLKSESSTEEPSCNFYEFYGIEYDEGEESI